MVVNVLLSFCDGPLSVVHRPAVRASVNNFFKQHPQKLLIGFLSNFTGMVPGWSPTKVVQMVLIGCISMSRGQKTGFQNATIKNLVRNYKAQSFHIWFSASSRDPQSCSNYASVVKIDLCPGSQFYIEL